MGFYKKVREFFWPILEPLEERPFTILNKEDLTVEDDNLDTCYDLTMKYYDSENDRKKTIESKSTIFVSAIGFVIAILLSMATGLLLNPNIKLYFLTSFSFIMWVVIVLYYCRAVWFSIRALERQEYHTIGHSDYMKGDADYRKKLIIGIVNKTRKNSLTINLKVDNMVMAQEYFKRGVVAVIIYALIAGGYGLLFMTNWNFNWFQNTILAILKTYWFPILNSVVLLVNIVLYVMLRKENIKS
ncbi:MAG: hypothetical protein KKA60_05800 [Proteobacteria bacterium]|nr:hypothetical protein [Pseudomonadota bacterium]